LLDLAVASRSPADRPDRRRHVHERETGEKKE
jgi:hypothetical protein